MNATGMSHAIVRLPRTGRFGRRLGPLWGPVRRAGYQLVGVMMVALFPALGCAQAPAESQQPVRRVPGMEVELKITDRFDANDDGWLNADERAAAREYLATEGTARRGPGGPGEMMGMPGGPARDGRMGPPPVDGARPPFGPGSGPPMGDGAGRNGNAGPRGARPAPGGDGLMPMGGRGAGGGRTVPGTPGPAVSPEDVQDHTGQQLYDAGTLRTLFLEFESQDWEAELAAFKDTDVDVPASVTVDGVEYNDVGVRFRGMSSFRMVSDGSKRSLNLSFDFIDDDQRIEGYRTLNLLNAMGDPSMMRTALYSHIARDFIPAPAANFVQVVINGESWGVYTNVQQFNKDFLRDEFDTTDGARWKVPGSPNGRAGLEYLGNDVEAYRSLYEIKSQDDEESWNALIELTRVLNETPVENLEDALEPILDIDGALKFLAIENVLVNSDGYWARASDYSLYRDVEGRFHVIPHDMNEGLGSSGSATLDPLVGLDDATKPLRSRLLAVPELRDRYLGYVQQIATEWLTWDALGPIVEQHRALIGAAVLEDTRKLYSSDDFEPAIDSLKTFVEQRREFLLR